MMIEPEQYKTINILIVVEILKDADTLVANLKSMSFPDVNCYLCDNRSEAEEILRNEKIDVIFVGSRRGAEAGFEVVKLNSQLDLLPGMRAEKRDDRLMQGELVNFIKTVDLHTGLLESIIKKYADAQMDVMLAKLRKEMKEREKAERALKKSELKFNAVVDSISEYIYSVSMRDDGHNLSVYHSPQCEIITGYTPDDFYSDHDLWYRMIHDDDRTRTLNFFHNINASNKSGSIEHRIIHKDGSIRWVLNHCSVTFSENGEKIRQDGILLDITDRKKIEEALRESEEKYRLLVENADDIIFSLDEEANFTSLNRSVERILGYTPEKLIGRDIGKILPLENLGLVFDRIRQLRRGDRDAVSIEMDMVSRSGEKVVLEVFARSIIRHEKFIGIHGAARDVTERRNAEKALRESEMKYRRIIDTAQEGIWLFDSRFRTSFANGRLVAMLKTTADDLKKMRLFDFLFPEDVEEMETQVKKLLGGSNLQKEIRVRDSEGQTFWALFNAAPIFDEDYRFAGGVGMFSDITESKKHSERKYFWASIAESSDDAIIGAAQDGRIVSWNRGAYEIYGYRADEIKDRSITILAMQEDHHELLSALHTTKERGGKYQANSIHKGKDGRLIDVSITISPILSDKDELMGSSVIIKDIRHLKQAEEELRKAKEIAEDATELKSKFISLVAHDLRSPFNSILGLLHLLEQGRLGPLNEKQRDVVSRVIGNGDELLKMIDELLNVNRFQAGKMKIRKKFFDAHYVINSSIDILDHLATRKLIQIKNKVQPGTRLFADVDLLREVIKNLLSNAIKFCRENDVVTIYIHEKSPGSIVVHDTGIGIPKELLPNLFRYDVQTTTKGTSGEKGTGLGLPLCSEIIKAHGGEIRVISDIGQGSSFIVDLPWTRPLVVIAEDSDTDRFLYRTYMESLDVDIIEAENGKLAYDIIQSRPVHIILTDLNMPVMNGLDLLRKVRENPSTSHIPVVALTSSATIATRDELIRNGANDFVPKPVMENDLIPRVRRFLT